MHESDSAAEAVHIEKVLQDLVLANHILAREGVVDAYGHVSLRHPDRADRFFLAASRSPELVTRGDIIEYDLAATPVVDRGLPQYLERPIHAGIYQARPDVRAVVHNHCHEVIPFGLTGIPLRPVLQAAGGIGETLPVWDMKDRFGDTDLLVTTIDHAADLAHCLGQNSVVLMRGHGCVVTGRSLQETVFLSIYLAVNAGLQLRAASLGNITFLSSGEIAATSARMMQDIPLQRAWEYWKRRANGVP